MRYPNRNLGNPASVKELQQGEFRSHQGNLEGRVVLPDPTMTSSESDLFRLVFLNFEPWGRTPESQGAHQARDGGGCLFSCYTDAGFSSSRGYGMAPVGPPRLALSTLNCLRKQKLFPTGFKPGIRNRAICLNDRAHCMHSPFLGPLARPGYGRR